MPLLHLQSLLPFLRWLPHCSKRSLAKDLLVGLNGAILALPQSIAYALIAGLPPQYGLYAAIVPVLIACLWGSSSYLICGPTAAISIVLFSSVSPVATPGSDDFIALILLLTLLAGVCQWLLGLLRFGALVNFVSHSVVLGFTLGAAMVIGIGQLPNLLGLTVTSQATALMSLLSLGEHLAESDWRTLAVALFTLAISLLRRGVDGIDDAMLLMVAGLFVLIEVFAPVSGAHFNPAVSAVMAWRGELPAAQLPAYVAVQLVGAACGAWLVHAMFEMPILQWSAKLRTGGGQWLAEVVATGGLLLVILRASPQRVSALVACYIGAAYFFTASTSFANPAAVFGRMFSDSFAGIAPQSAPAFMLAQVVGAALGALLHAALGGRAPAPSSSTASQV